MQPTEQTPKIEKPPKVRVAVFFDTNFLFIKDKRTLISEFFKNFTSRYSGDLDCGLFFPDTVLMELKYQTMTVALEAVKSLQAKSIYLSELSRLKIGSHLSENGSPLTEEAVRIAIDQAYEEVVRNYGIQIIPLPHDCFDMREVQSHSVNRVGVFEATRSNDDGKVVEVGEKGFRDYLIQRTLEKFFESIAGYQRYVVLTMDKRLSVELTKLKAPQGMKVEVFNTQEDTYSFFNGILSLESTEWIKKLLPFANQHFSDLENKSGLWFHEVKNMLNAKFGNEIYSLAPNHWFDFKGDWKKTGSNWSILPVQYDRKDGDVYTWTTELEYRQGFSRPNPSYVPIWPNTLGGWQRGATLDDLAAANTVGRAVIGSAIIAGGAQYMPQAQTEDTMAILKFKVKWQADVNEQAEFSNLKVITIEKEVAEN